ncbi:MAG TPA: (S)-benzoin forming benzil reductase [Candidatus Pseudogracilibacillus intestinigallinarum]|uniref:(S)-benzoin forming benzil reductase n=1 Tax=Candidatus Pseudogracilibacillus intestinigallinarum TaxID=2838742 RepID=A0A9D1TLQ5_9BACI|nr:(S)-benzoin forming benzil reductase [Candidatus Pseudogracilibacillus intestinigallinarum]
MTIAIVTGASKGLGKSVAKFLLESNIDVFGVSRTNDESLEEVAAQSGATYTFFPTDLANIEDVKKTMEQIKEKVYAMDGLSQMYVVNNAAVVEPIKKSLHILPEELMTHYHVNVVAPMILMNEFLHVSMKRGFQLIGVNVTSGAAESPYYGWSAYCSSKASLNMYTKTVALEQEKLGTSNKVFAFSPGKMDTEMQGVIRSTDYEHFVDVDTFKHYKQQNILSDTEAVASVLTDILTDAATIENGKVYYVRDYF